MATREHTRPGLEFDLWSYKEQNRVIKDSRDVPVCTMQDLAILRIQ